MKGGRRPIVGVMGSGVEPWQSYAWPLGRWLASAGVHLLTGGGRGVMAAVCQSYRAGAQQLAAGAHGLSIGLLPVVGPDRLEPPPGYPNAWVDVPVVVPLEAFDPERGEAASRNWANVLTADVVVALPGGAGTRNEIALARRFAKPLALFGPLEQFEGLASEIPHFETMEGLTAWLEKRLEACS
jgi:predicted Rossmann-fold nucleotide-binding protein